MINLIFENHSFGKIVGSYEDLMALWEQFSYYVPGYRFMPAYERGTWDGKIRLINLSKKTFPTGLVHQITDFCKETGIEYNVDLRFSEVYTTPNSKEELMEFINSRKYYSKGNEIYPREDQIKAICNALMSSRCINICPTSFGKSLCIFIESLYYISRNKRVMIVVPSVNLVRQFTNDIYDYCNDKDVPIIQEIYAGKSKILDDDTEIVITTWQSIYKLDSDWFNQFGCIILDEAHKGSANCIRTVYEKSTEVPCRTGWTGSLKEASLVGIQMEALIGPIRKITDTHTLMEAGVVADLTIQIVRFNYPESLVKQLTKYLNNKKGLTGSGKNVYTDEIKFLESNYERNKTIINMAATFKSTGLLLYTHLAHGKVLYEMVRKMYPERNVYRIDGSCVIRNDEKFNNFEVLKPTIEKEDNAILICSFGVFSTGISIKNLHYVFFTVPIKSYVRTIQSIGRGLRISETKKSVQLIDIVDDLCTKTKTGKTKKENYAFKHFRERFNMYSEQQFKYNLLSINIKD